MKVVIVTSRGREHAFVSKLLIEALGNHLSGIVIERGVKSGPSFHQYKKYSSDIVSLLSSNVLLQRE